MTWCTLLIFLACLAMPGFHANADPIRGKLITIADPSSTIFAAISSDECIGRLNNRLTEQKLDGKFVSTSAAAGGSTEKELADSQPTGKSANNVLFVSGTGLAALHPNTYALQLPGFFRDPDFDLAWEVGAHLAQSCIDGAGTRPRGDNRWVPVAIGPLSRVRLYTSDPITNLADMNRKSVWTYPDEFTNHLLRKLGMVPTMEAETNVARLLQDQKISGLYGFDAWIFGRGWASYMRGTSGTWYVTPQNLPLNIIFASILVRADLVDRLEGEWLHQWGRQCLQVVEKNVGGFKAPKPIKESNLMEADLDLKTVWEIAASTMKNYNDSSYKSGWEFLGKCRDCVAAKMSGCKKECDLANAL